MKAKAVELIIDLSLTTKVSKFMWSWEIPVLEAKYGGKVETIGETTRDVSHFPDAQKEYVRLGNIYGVDSETKVPFVEYAFGRPPSAFDVLQKLIDASKVKVTRAKKPRTKKSKEPADPLAATA